MKKIVSVLSILCLCVFLFASCSKTQSPEDAAKAYFEAYQNFDAAKMAGLTVAEATGSAAVFTTSGSDESSVKMYKSIAKKTTMQEEGKAVVNGDTATIKVKITSPDTKTIMQNALSSAFSQAMSQAFSSDPANSQDTNSQMLNQVVSDVSKADVKLTSTEMELQLVKKDGKWKVKMTENLGDAMTGGMVGYLKNLSDTLTSSK